MSINSSEYKGFSCTGGRTELDRRVRQFLFDQIIFGESPIDPIELWLDLGPGGARPIDRTPPHLREQEQAA